MEQLQHEKEALQRELRQLQHARNAWDTERRELNSQIERLGSQIQRVSESPERVSDEIVDQLRKQYEQRLQETIQQKTQLAEQLQNTSSLLAAERARLSAGQSQSSGSDQTLIPAEVSRVAALIKEIVALIDNPETELSTIIRKNGEKAELDAYLKG